MKNGRNVAGWLAAAMVAALAGSVWGQSLAPVNPAFARWQREKAAKGAAQEADTAKPRAARSAAARGEAGGEDMDFGFVPTVLDTGYLSTLNDNLAQGVGDEPPEAYDLREEGALTPVRDQGAYGNCWAFATMGSLESWIKKTEGEEPDFSENHLANLHGWSQKFGAGGNGQMAQAYLLRWAGPVAESEDSYPRPEKSVPGRVLRHVQRVRWIPGRTGYLDNDGIKAALRTYGALQASYYHSSGYYNAKAASYYFDAGGAFRLENHAVDLVGWDDNYSRKNFKRQPPGDGAFIVRNSWGSGWGDGGYFHVSYYDESFAWSPLYSFSSAEPTDNYDGIYQYDPLGLVGSVGYNGPTAWGANLFTAGEASKVAAVGFYAMTPRTTYKLFVYTGCRAGEPRSGTLAAQQSGTVDLAGFATVPLETPAAVAAGQRFSVVLELTTPGYAYPLAAEYAVAGYSGAATAHEGESFLSANGTAWHDFTKRVGSTANFCCKAYVKGAVAEKTLAGIAIAGVNSLKAGSSAAFTCTASYSDGSAKAVSPSWRIAEGGDWADVSGDGTVTAKAVEEERTVTVEASYSEGDVTKTATWAFRVTVAPPAAPTGLTATEGTEDSCVRLSWTASAGASGYSVYRGKREGASHAAYLGNVTAPRYADTTAEPGRDYRYFVKAKNGSGSSEFGEGAWGWRALAAPTGVTASDGSKENLVELVWNRSEGGSHYQVWRVEADAAAEADLVSVSEWLTACQWADATAAAGVVYAYSVTAALDADGTRASAASLPDEGYRTGPKALEAIEIAGPVSLASGARGSYFCTAIYNDGARVPALPEWTLDAGTLEVGDGFAAVTAPPASENTGIVLGAVFADGDESRTASLAITVVPVIPAAPDGLELVSESEDGIALRWNPVADASGYQVWRAAADGEASVVASTTETGYLDASAVPGVAYIYRVGSVNAAGAGEPGAESVAAMRPIAAPGGIAASYGLFTDKVAVSWNACEGAAFYRVWRAESADGEKTALGGWQEELVFDDTDATAGVLYYYSVQAAADSAGSAASAFGGPAVGMRKVAPRPVSLEIFGPNRVAAESTAAYIAKATYDNASVRTVVPLWSLSGADGCATIDEDGILQAGAFGEDRNIVVSAAYAENDRTVEGQLPVALLAPLVKTAAITALDVHARWPWNGWVDVDYTLETAPSGTVAKITLSGYDLDHKAALAATTLAGDGARGETVEAGKHRISWNAGADYPDFHASQIKVSLNAVPSDPYDPGESDEPTLEKGGLSVAMYDLDTTAFPYSAWCASHDGMMAYFAAKKPTLETNTVYVGEDFDFGFTGWYGTCALPGKYGEYGADDFAALFTGYIEVPETGTYRFRIISDDGVALYIGRKFACGTTGEAGGTYDGSIALESGLHEIALAFHERGERQGLQVNWQMPSAADLAVLPQSVLYHAVQKDGGGDGEDDPEEPEPEPGTGGLTAEFFDLGSAQSPYGTWCASYAEMAAWFSGLTRTIATNTIYVGKTFDFGFTGWSGTCAFPGKYARPAAEDFAALFTGSIEVPETGTYRFRALSDDGMALYIDRKLACGTTGEASGTYDGSIGLAAGVHDFVLAYHERGERQGLQIYWQRPSDGELVLLPQSVLRTERTEGDEPAPPPERSGGLAARFFDLTSTESPCPVWCTSREAMTAYFAGMVASLATNTAYLGSRFDFGFTGWYGTCAFPGKYGDYAADDFAALFTGRIRIEEAGTYQFQILSDDGTVMYIDGELACGATVDENGTYDGSIELAAGMHDIALAYRERGERQGLQVYWQPPSGSGLVMLPQSVLYLPGGEEEGEGVMSPLDFPEGLVGYWPFDGNAKDAGGYGNDGTVYGATLVADRNGRADSAYRFGGSAYVRVPDSESLRLPTRAITIAAWLKVDKAMIAEGVCCKGTGHRQYGLAINKVGDSSAVYVNDYYGVNAVDVLCTNCPPILASTDWHHLATVWDGSSLRIYEDGRQVSETHATGVFATNRDDLLIGADPPGSWEYFMGCIDDFAIWERALTAEEVARLYAGEKPEPEPAQPLLSDGLVAYWPFDGDAKDASGNGNDGIVYGASLAEDRNGKANGAYHFDGNDSIEVVDSASLRSPTNAISISAWVHPEVTNCVVICKGVSKRQYGFFWDAQNMYINDRCGESRVDVICHNCPSLPVVGTWQHVVATWDGKTMKVYINGNKIGEEAASGVWASNNINLFIGKDSPGATDYYSGYLDDLAIWNRALTADEVTQLYERGMP